jgi:hypothetical protein
VGEGGKEGGRRTGPEMKSHSSHQKSLNSVIHELAHL